jgi:WD repeat-containing protein 35
MTNQIGNYYAERLEWDKASEFYINAKNYRGLIDCFTMIEDYDSLAQIIDEIPENDPMLCELADRFQLAGMAEYAVKCYERMG